MSNFLCLSFCSCFSLYISGNYFGNIFGVLLLLLLPVSAAAAAYLIVVAVITEMMMMMIIVIFIISYSYIFVVVVTITLFCTHSMPITTLQYSVCIHGVFVVFV